MIKDDISKLKVITVISVECDSCGNIFNRTIRRVMSTRLKYENRDICRSCSAKLSISKKPQCSKDYWSSEEVKSKHSTAIKNSELYHSGIQNREDIFGEKNPMYGKSHSIETITKMSISRTGKLGENATAWKGGKLTITRMVKGFQYRNGWYSKIYERDSYKCIKCKSNNKIEAHHITPVKYIVNQHKYKFSDKIEFYEFLIRLDIIIDENLENGITLCRECHKMEHSNFGSHNPNICK